jgi:hypothetical protein
MNHGNEYPGGWLETKTRNPNRKQSSREGKNREHIASLEKRGGWELGQGKESDAVAAALIERHDVFPFVDLVYGHSEGLLSTWLGVEKTLTNSAEAAARCVLASALSV